LSTLDELVYYCRNEHPIGALVLLGESGCGKTYLIDKDLQNALRDSHYIVRVSLFGINSIDALNTAVKRQWIYTVSSFLTKLSKQSSQMELGKGFVRAFNSILRTVIPQTEGLTDAIQNSTDFIVIMPEVENPYNGEKKKVILVFDDIDRTELDWLELLGTINNYCENQHFNTILIANRNYFHEIDPETMGIIRAAKEKTIAYTVLNSPDYEGIVHRVITGRNWEPEEYGEFLKEHEQMILEVFGSEPLGMSATAPLSKHHNIRTLTTALESFHRIYCHMTNALVRDIDPYFRSFLAFYLVVKSGIFKNGNTCFECTDAEIGKLYPDFSADHLFESVRRWIRFGSWDGDLFLEELSRVSPVDMTELLSDEDTALPG